MAGSSASIPSMLDTMSRWFLGAPRRMVVAGLWMFFAGALGLLLGLLSQVATAPGEWPLLLDWAVPQSPLGYTAAATLVCWGTWAMGAGVRAAREAARPHR